MMQVELTPTEKSVLNTVRHHENCQKNKIAELTGLPTSSVSVATDKLLDKKMLIDDKECGINICCDYKYFIGISVGSSQTKVSICNFALNTPEKNYIIDHLPKSSRFRGEFWENNEFNLYNGKDAHWCATTNIKTSSDAKDALSDIREFLNEMCEFSIELYDCGIHIASINFVFPGYIKEKEGLIEDSKNLWSSLRHIYIDNLIYARHMQELEKRGICVGFDHNVKVAAVAEKELHYYYTDANLAVLYLGTGIGGAFILNNMLYRGRTNRAGQMGEEILFAPTDKCDNESFDGKNNEDSDKKNSFEAIIRKKVFNCDSIDEMRDLTGKKLASDLNENDRKTNKDLLVDFLSWKIFNLVCLLEIDIFVLSGKFAEIYNSIEIDLRDSMIIRNINNKRECRVLIKPSLLGEFSSSIGAAICGYYNYLGLPYEWK